MATRVRSVCDCFICNEARVTIGPRSMYPKVNLKEIDDVISENIKPNDKDLCSYCFTPVGRGLLHNCTKVERQRNLATLVRETSPVTKGRVLSFSLKEGLQSGDGVELSTFGPRKIKVGGTRPTEPYFTVEKMNLLQNKLHARY